MKYRIITNGHTWRIKYKIQWWPFWVTLKYHYDGLLTRDFRSKEKAEECIAVMKQLNARESAEWKVIDEL